MAVTRKEGSTLQPLVLNVDFPADVVLDDSSVVGVRLLLRRARSRGAADVDEEIVQGAERTDWQIDSDGSLEVTWYDDPDSPLPAGYYLGEVWITDINGALLKAPSRDNFRIVVEHSIPSHAS